MSTEDLRDLLQERVADASAPDLSAAAWRDAARLRTRRRAAVGAAVAAVVTVAGVATAVDHSRSQDRGGPAVTPEPVDPADATVLDAPVFWSPEPAAEGDLPATGGGVLPERVDLAAGAASVADAPVPRATAAFVVYAGARLARIVLLTPDGDRSLDPPAGIAPGAAGLGVVLSPDGATLEVSGDGGVATYSFGTGRWSAATEGAPAYPDLPPQVAGAHPYGATAREPGGVRTAQAYGRGSSVPVPAGDLTHPETVAVAPRLGPPTILAITTPQGSAARSPQCCPVAGWLADDTVVYASRGTVPVLVAWRVGTHDFGLVSRIEGLAPGEAWVAGVAAAGGA
jgi:hypothetical protein